MLPEAGVKVPYKRCDLTIKLGGGVKMSSMSGLDELRKDGWSYHLCGTVSPRFILIDGITGKWYELTVSDGKLTMTEVSKE